MKVFLNSIGCRLNQAEIEKMGREFRAAKHQLVAEVEEADLAVINTCAVTGPAAADSRSAVRRAHRVNENLDIVLTGCWSTLDVEAARSLPGVRKLVSNDEKETLVPAVLEMSSEFFDQEPLKRVPLPGLRMKTRAHIKAQDGCNYACSFCTTTQARGVSRSVEPELIQREIEAALAGGAKEIVLTGVALSSYGRDLSPGQDLGNLITRILKNTDVPRLRLSSLEPWGLPDNFLSLWEDGRMCRHLHLPLQAGSNATLKAMNRPSTVESFRRLLEEARTHIPGVAITTDILVGFPTESSEHFEESLNFVREAEFSNAHIFRYSPRKGTDAIEMQPSFKGAEVRLRSMQMRSVVNAAKAAFVDAHAGSTLSVLWESMVELGPRGWKLSGLSDNYIRVEAYANQSLWNELTDTVIIDADIEGVARGRILQ